MILNKNWDSDAISQKDKMICRNGSLRLGTAETDIKISFNYHTESSDLEYCENDTELSQEYWTIRRSHFTQNATLRILRKCAPFNTIKRKCCLCLNENL